MIYVTCRTNLDGYENIKWPGTLQCLPRIGDRIGSVNKGSSQRSLKVVSITHYAEHIELELHISL